MGGMRGGGGDSDDEDEGGQRIGFDEGAISFDQVNMAAVESEFRRGGTETRADSVSVLPLLSFPQAKRIAVGAAWRSRG